MKPRRLRLFLYGTLQPQVGTDMGAWIAARLVASGPASAPGRLYGIRSDKGWFPALVPARGAQNVRGTLCTLRLEAGDLALLDRYEGAEYRRRTVPVRTAAGRRILAQTYEWRVGLPADASPIVGGDFLGWLHTGRRRAFGGT